jgi:signal transduction histidine kinase/CheY-like chemotaxis protein
MLGDMSGDRGIHSRDGNAPPKHAGPAVVVLDAADRVTFATPGVADLLGGAPVLGRSLSAVAAAGSLADRLARAIESRRAAAMAVLREGDPADPRESGFEDQFCVLSPHSPCAVACRIVFMRDGTAACSLTDARLESSESLLAPEVGGRLRQAQKMEALGQLAAGVAHDFNNLLTAIRGHVSIARSTLPRNHPALDNLGHVEQAAAQAAGVVNSLMTFGRNAPGQRRTVCARAMVDQVACMFRRTIPAWITFTTREEPNVEFYVDADPHLIQQSLLNLLINARDAIVERVERDALTPHGSEAARTGAISVWVERARDAERTWVQIRVADDGVGMEPAQAARVFEPFYTTKPRGRGTGLGLSIVHTVVREHGGRLDFSTRPMGGTTFSLRLPAVPPPDAVEPSAMGPGITVRPRGGRALIVEPNPLVRGLLVSMLETLGFRATQAPDAATARAMDSSDAPLSIVVAALTLADTDAAGLLATLRAAHPRVAMIVVTTETQLPATLAGEAGVRLVRKPFDLADIRRALAELSAEAEGEPRETAAGVAAGTAGGVGVGPGPGVGVGGGVGVGAKGAVEALRLPRGGSFTGGQ